MRNKILNSVYEMKNKNTDENIEINNKELVFENSKYSSTKDSIYHVYINGIKLKKTSEFLISYKCIHCDKSQTISTTQLLRKIRKCKEKCYNCMIINLNLHKKDNCTIKEIPINRTHNELYEYSKQEFELQSDLFKTSYFLNHLSIDEYNKISKNIISFSNGTFTDITNFDYWPILKVNNQMKYTSVLYDKINNTIIKINQPVIKCDNCLKSWRSKSLITLKNCYKILCPDCKLCNRTFKIRSTKNIRNENIIYQSKLEKKFIDWANSQNIVVVNGPSVDYTFNNSNKKYRINFAINNMLIEIKDFHIWHKNQVESGMWDKKVEAANEYIKTHNLYKYYFITPNNWKQMINEITNKLNKI
jgi:Zn finger protein HypA/HybF involved in hydrogenase expression